MRRPAVLLLLLLALTATVALAGCGGSEETLPTAETVVGELPESETTESTETEDEPADTGTDDGDDGAAGSTAAGMEIFAAAGCGGCHTLADAGASGQVGPNLDETMPDTELVVERVTNGAGAMPSFSSSLDEQQIADVAAYVSSVAGS